MAAIPDDENENNSGGEEIVDSVTDDKEDFANSEGEPADALPSPTETHQKLLLSQPRGITNGGAAYLVSCSTSS